MKRPASNVTIKKEKLSLNAFEVCLELDTWLTKEFMELHAQFYFFLITPITTFFFLLPVNLYTCANKISKAKIDLTAKTGLKCNSDVKV